MTQSRGAAEAISRFSIMMCSSVGSERAELAKSREAASTRPRAGLLMAGIVAKRFGCRRIWRSAT